MPAEKRTGVPASPGRAAGPVVHMPPRVPEPATNRIEPEAVEAAADAVRDAAVRVERDLAERAERAAGTAADILSVTAAMAADPTLAADAARRVRADHLTPERAVWDAAGTVATQLESLGGPMAERARDVRDVRDRIVAVLTGAPPPGVPDPGHPFVLVATDLAPADTATLDPAAVLAVVTARGGPTSHTAIIARSLGIPAVVALGEAADLSAGETVLVDGTDGVVLVAPGAADLSAAGLGDGSDDGSDGADAGAGRFVRRRPSARDAFDGTAATRDGHDVDLVANVADPAEADAAAGAGARGVGLFRTEFCFLGRGAEPTVDEQVDAYRAVLTRFAGGRVVVRTLDAGADKPLRFLTPGHEDNPALGVRGIRTAVDHPDVLDRQLEAISRAARAERAEVWVMAPMVATADETREFVAACAAHDLTTAGVMIETPAAAIQARWLLADAAFASLGTNDLTQYTMAADRDLAGVAALSTPWQPAVLDLVRVACEGGAVHGRPVGVCGEAAADPLLAPVLVGLGVASLSMTPRALAAVADALRRVTLEQCRELAANALDKPTARAAREAVRDARRDVP
ncbi:phosphoenolpyruvate--protein phosphotransferase [Myceligenerans pegani]|uniref:Phosphoenolpyruvate-protein phosphotransferase n=1 Tax=Myceligenerans pegani TaxID=2776917 RepID=A0ABR9MTD9_9MICO|nr:phosphoenolpyruvate--protein phosphotransferase [Myceligenerans sp. TRM 65318]MBE1874163.1 phosphoenolpyruvate--protein phosphotransferase [Myceligenerans sp. TRM 65318]MBE3016435.1 phosphoenolpyruvate--protein phosphotransferase [Myceligenerans sp. TRM 65318]